MKPYRPTLTFPAMLLAMVLACACGRSETIELDSGPGGAGGTGGSVAGAASSGTGGRPGTGGAAAVGTGGLHGTGGLQRDGGSHASGGMHTEGGAPGSGGRTGRAGATGNGGKTGSGGAGSGAAGGSTPLPGTGGSHMDGGAPGRGGRTGGGGATGAGGSDQCGGPSAATCMAGLFCDLASDCGGIANASGTCVLTGPQIACTEEYAPVCGCDGKTYSNDCMRRAAGMPKASTGACAGNDAGAVAYPGGYLVWKAPGGVAGTGPAVVVSAQGFAKTWSRTGSFPLESPPADATASYPLTTTQTDDLFARLMAVNLASLPHPNTQGFFECYPSLYFRLCEGCEAKTLKYENPQQLDPEMDPVWLWFDQVLGKTISNPRNYCNLDL